MRIGKITACMAAFAAVAFASTANAQQFSLSSTGVTPGTATFTTTTPAFLSQTSPINCTISTTLNVAASPPLGAGTADLTGDTIAAPSSPFCGFIVFPNGNWYAQATSLTSGTVDLWIGANTIIRDPCYGRVTAGFTTNASGTTITLNNVQIPAASNRADRVCTINAILTSPTPVYIVP